MPHQLSTYVSELPTVEDWLAGDDRTLAFQVVDEDGNGVDITAATVHWELFERPYESDPSEAIIAGSDSDVELVTDSRVDAGNGEWEVRIEGGATDGEWGVYTQRPRVEQTDGTEASWLGEVILTA